jgi:predicted nucleotidyltransferase
MEEVRAAWLGGSDAFGTADELSDVDLSLEVEEGAVARVFAAIEEAADARGGIAACWRVPEPAWHGHSQRFYRLEDAPETLLLDVAVMERGRPGMRFLEREQHGEPVVLFDRDGTIASEALDREANAAKMRDRLEQLAARAAIFGSFPDKEARRGRALDALAFWQSMIVAPLVEVLRMRWCPERFTFGMRYLDRDLPREVHARLVELAYVRDLADLRAQAPAARAWLDAEIAAARPQPPAAAPASGA